MDRFTITDSETDEDDKEIGRFAMTVAKPVPIVYTTKLEQMSIFREDMLNTEPKRILKAILNESKPKFKRPKNICNDNNNYATYDEMVQKLDDVFVSNKTKTIRDTIVIDDEDSEVSSDDDIPIQMLVNKANKTWNTNTVELDAQNVDEDVVVVEKYRSAFLSFSCTNTNVTDIYYIDENGVVTLHNRITIYNKLDIAEFVGLTEAFVLLYCCWFKRREMTLALDELPKETLEFMSEQHNCILSSCTCCCSPQKKNKIKSRNMTRTTNNEPKEQVDDDAAAIKDKPISMDYEISQMLNKRKITEKKIKNKKPVMANKNKWLQEVMSAVLLTSTACTSTSTNSLAAAITTLTSKKFEKKSSKLLKRNIIYRPAGHLVINLTFQELCEIYEFYEGKIISSATIVNNDYLSREVFKSCRSLNFTNNLAKDISLAARESNEDITISTVKVPCCWYLREVLINARHGAYDFMRQPHSCSVGRCACCCKSMRSANLDRKIQLHVRNKSFHRLLDDFVPTHQLAQFCNVDLRSRRKAPGKTKPVFAVANPTVTCKTPHKHVSKTRAPSHKISGPEFSWLNDQIQNLEIDECPSHLPVPTDSHELVSRTHNTEENPSSKITLFTPEMACTITTYALNSNETLNELDGSDPLGEMSADVKDSLLETEKEIEEDDETVSNDVESDPLIYAKVEEDTTLDPLAVDKTLIEIKEEPHGIPTNSSVDARATKVVEHPTTILDRFRKIQLFINEQGLVTAEIGVCVSTLSKEELKVLANILSKAQEQVQHLGLVPGTILCQNVPTQTTVAQQSDLSEANTLPSFMDNETNGEMVIPRIENVFSLNDTQEKKPDAPTLRVRPLTELGVIETNTLAQGNNTLETCKSTSWLQMALNSEMKPMNIQHSQDQLLAENSSNTFDPQKIQKFVIPKGHHQSQSTQTPAKYSSQQNIQNATLKRKPAAATPTFKRRRRNKSLLRSSKTAISATSFNPSSSFPPKVPPYVISLDSDDD